MLTRIGETGPDARLGLRQSSSSRRWEFDPGRLAEAVETVDPVSEATVLELMSSIAQARTAEHDLKLYVAGNYLIAAASHGLGDGRLSVLIQSELLDHRNRDRVPDWASSKPGRGVLASSLARWFCSDPRRLLALASAARENSGAATTSSVLYGATYEPTVRYCRIDGELLADLDCWRSDMAPDATRATLLFSILARALQAAGIAISSTSHILADARRYSPRAVSFNGNFAVGLDFPFPPPFDSQDLASRLHRALSAGRPLAAMGLGAVRSSVPRRKAQNGTLVPALPVASFSDVGHARSVESVDWCDETSARSLMGMVEPHAYNGISFVLVQVGREMNISASFNAAVHDPQLIQAALTATRLDPVALARG